MKNVSFIEKTEWTFWANQYFKDYSLTENSKPASLQPPNEFSFIWVGWATQHLPSTLTHSFLFILALESLLPVIVPS